MSEPTLTTWTRTVSVILETEHPYGVSTKNSFSAKPIANRSLTLDPCRHRFIILVYGVVIGGSIALVLLVLSTVYKQDYAQRRNNRSLRVEEHRPRLNSEKIEDLRAVGRTEDGSQAGQGIAR
jgi:hypothetical protein